MLGWWLNSDEWIKVNYKDILEDAETNMKFNYLKLVCKTLTIIEAK